MVTINPDGQGEPVTQLIGQGQAVTQLIGQGQGVTQMVPCSVSTGDLDKLTLALQEAEGQQPSPEKILARRRSASLLNLNSPTASQGESPYAFTQPQGEKEL